MRSRTSTGLLTLGIGLCVTAMAGEARADPDTPGERYTVFRVGADAGHARITRTGRGTLGVRPMG